MDYNPSECQCAMCKLSKILNEIRGCPDHDKCMVAIAGMQKIVEDERQGKKTFPGGTGNEH